MKRVTIQELAHNVLKLPRLSIPLLKNTLDAYRTSISPLKPADVVAQHLAHLDAFLASSANDLQNKLVEADKLAEQQGKVQSYLESFHLQQHLAERSPLEVYANRSIVLQKNAIATTDGNNLSQSKVAAQLTHGIAQWIKMAQTHGVSLSWLGAISDASVPIAERIDTVHTDSSTSTREQLNLSSASSANLSTIPLDMSPLLTEFGRSRIPGKDIDEIVTTPLSELQHIIVLHDGHPYLIRVFDDNHNVVNYALLEKAFEVILSITPDQDNTSSVSVLTAGNRALWGQTYQELIKTPENATTLELFAKSIIVICLDSKGWESTEHTATSVTADVDAVVSSNSSSSSSYNDSGCTIANSHTSHHKHMKGIPCNKAQIASMHGGVEEIENRWYDKHQVIISADGHVAFNFEPSLSDRVHWAKWIDDVLAIISGKSEMAQLMGIVPPSGSSSSSESVDASRVSTIMRPLSVTYGKTFASHIRTARQEATTLAADTEVHTIHIPIGKNALREHGLRAGALVQMCVQLAEYNLRDKISPSAEECSTAAFFHGLTESARVATVELQHVVERLSDVQKSANEHHESQTIMPNETSTSTTKASSTESPIEAQNTSSPVKETAQATSATQTSAASQNEKTSSSIMDEKSTNNTLKTENNDVDVTTNKVNNISNTKEDATCDSKTTINNTANIITNNGMSPRVSTNTKEELTQYIKSAVKQHVALTDAARSGNGIDGHLRALHQLAIQHNDSAGLNFFNDDVYRSTSTYSFYASQMSLPWMRYFVIGPVSSNGYGLGYVVDDDEIRLTICALSSNPATSVTDMEIAILNAAATVANTLGIKTDMAETK